jgi:hypothetical protein
MAINPKDIWKTCGLDKQCKLNKTILKIKACSHNVSQAGIDFEENQGIGKKTFDLQVRTTKNNFKYFPVSSIYFFYMCIYLVQSFKIRKTNFNKELVQYLLIFFIR